VLFITKNGVAKKTSLEEYVKTKKKTGIAAISLKDDDTLASVNLVKDEDIILITHDGMIIRFNSKEVAATSRATTGVKGMGLKNGDYIVAALPVRHETDEVAIFCENGLGKKFPLSEIMVQKRAGKGLICNKNNPIACATLVSNEDSILIIGDTSSVCISATEIPLLSRGAVGNQLIKNNSIKSVTKI
jgi:DNA gyrase subunit A